jgi:hypothetical protein
MHDRNGRTLKAGDVVLVPAVIKELSATEDYCNVTIVSVFGRRPDDMKETIHAINTGVVLRANKGDENDLADLG